MDNTDCSLRCPCPGRGPGTRTHPPPSTASPAAASLRAPLLLGSRPGHGVPAWPAGHLGLLPAPSSQLAVGWTAQEQSSRTRSLEGRWDPQCWLPPGGACLQGTLCSESREAWAWGGRTSCHRERGRPTRQGAHARLPVAGTCPDLGSANPGLPQGGTRWARGVRGWLQRAPHCSIPVGGPACRSAPEPRGGAAAPRAWAAPRPSRQAPPQALPRPGGPSNRGKAGRGRPGRGIRPQDAFGMRRWARPGHGLPQDGADPDRLSAPFGAGAFLLPGSVMY